MKKPDLGQTFTILANIGVVVGILLLVFELSQNRQMMQAQTRHDLSQGIVDQLLIQAVEFPSLIVRARSDFSSLSEEDVAQFNTVVNARLRYWEDVHYQYRLGLFDESEFATQIGAWRDFLGSAAVSERWRLTRHTYSPEFAADIDGLVLESEVE